MKDKLKKKMSEWIYALKRFVLVIFGDIKIFKWPFFLIYQATTFRIKGHHTREIMAKILPGDIIMRAYDDYLDTHFIPKGESGCSHSGLYIGGNLIVHSIAEGSIIDDIIDYCRADKIVVLRPKGHQTWAIEHAKKCADANIEYDFDFSPAPGKYYCHEFTASCFPDFNIETVSRKFLRFIPSPKAFLADSFYINANFTRINLS